MPPSQHVGIVPNIGVPGSTPIAPLSPSLPSAESLLPSQPPSDWGFNGIAITENSGLGPGIQQRLILNAQGIVYRVGAGGGVGGGLNAGFNFQAGPQVTGWNVQGTVNGGYIVGGSYSGTLGNGTANNVTIGIGIGAGATVTYGPTIFVPWPWR